MKYEINSVWYSGKKEILDIYPILKKFNPKIDYPYPNKEVARITIKIRTLKDIKEIINETGEELIIGEDVITIYDSCVEVE